MTLPKAWWVPAEQTEVIDRLRLHGIRFEAIDAPRTLELDRVRLVDPVVQRAQDGRYPLKSAFTHEAARETLPAGTIRVPADQPLGLLAAALLEPEAPDSFVAWGFFPELLSPASRGEDFIRARLAEAMLRADGKVLTAFERRLAADADFAADSEARLAWLLACLPIDAGRHVYPVRRQR